MVVSAAVAACPSAKQHTLHVGRPEVCCGDPGSLTGIGNWPRYQDQLLKEHFGSLLNLCVCHLVKRTLMMPFVM
ncbi:hypothetical protein MRX96_055485 [Rhipicephalus microplus]